MVDKQLLNKIQFRHHPLHNFSSQGISLDRKYVRLLSYNLFLRPFVKNNENDWKDERLNQFVQMLDDFDIICNQEVFDFLNKHRRHKIISYAQKAGFFYYCHSDPSPIFCNSMIDGGLLILSRFPIMETEFRPYNYGVLSDAMTSKGCLYAKISINGRILHLFTTHTQASYFDVSVEDFRATFEARLDQMKTVRKFIEEKTRDAPESHLIILAGDLNVNGTHVEKSSSKYRKLLKEKPEFNLALDDFEREYYTMMDILSRDDEDEVIDVLRVANNGVSPVTFGDSAIDENGNEYSLETVMQIKEDQCSKQSLDYIFEIRRSFNLSQAKTASSTGQKPQEESKKAPEGLRQRTRTPQQEKEDEAILKGKLEIDVSKSKVEKFLFDTHPIVKQVSDHYGVSTCINVI